MDRRVLKTKKAIHNAFVKLLAEKDIDDITVKDIADTADINRKTFYNYYTGVYQVVDEMEDEIVRRFEETTKDMDFEKTMQQPYVVFDRLSKIINEDFEFFSLLFRSKKNTSLKIKTQNTLVKSAKERLTRPAEIDETAFNIMIEFIFMGIMSTYHNWFNSDRTQSIEEISKTIGILCIDGMNGLIRSSQK